MKCLDCQFGTPRLDEGTSGALKGIGAWCSIYEQDREEPCDKFVTSVDFLERFKMADD